MDPLAQLHRLGELGRSAQSEGSAEAYLLGWAIEARLQDGERLGYSLAYLGQVLGNVPSYILNGVHR